MDADEFKASFAGIWDGWQEVKDRMLKAEQVEKDKHKNTSSRYNDRYRTCGKGWIRDTRLALPTSGPQRNKRMVIYQRGVSEAEANGTQNVWPLQG